MDASNSLYYLYVGEATFVGIVDPSDVDNGFYQDPIDENLLQIRTHENRPRRQSLSH